MTDVHELCKEQGINTPVEVRKKLNIGDIYTNALICKKCKEYIRSKNRHDFVRCKCGACAIDGGSWYTKILGYPDDIEIKCEYFTELHNDSIKGIDY
jgi:hypothetical protein